MNKWCCLLLLPLVAFGILSTNSLGQSQSNFALIKHPILLNPTTWELTKQFANQELNVDLFLFPNSCVESYVADPNFYVYSSVRFTLDQSWNRFLYAPGEANWIRQYGSWGNGPCQVKWPRSIEALAPCNDQGRSNFYYGYIADTKNNRILRFRYNWASQTMICDPPITGLGLSRPADINLNDGRSFWSIGEDNLPGGEFFNYLWVVNSPNGVPCKIKRINTQGVLKNTFGTYGCDGVSNTFCKITAVASGRSTASAAPYSNNDYLYVADVGNNRIVWLYKETNGERIFWYGEVPCGSGFIDLEVDHFGHVWALDRDAGTVTKYTYDLFPLCTFGSTGIGENQFMHPVSISDPVGLFGSRQYVYYGGLD